MDAVETSITFCIGIPAYKNNFLKECIDSILSQTYTNFNVVILNDASPYNLDEIINKYTDTRISYFKNEYNVGAENVVDNWNKCLQYATADFFVLMGDDDIMMPNYLSEFVTLIKKYPQLDVYHCRSKIIDENGTGIKYTNSWPEYESVYDNMYHRLSDLREQYISDFVYRTKPLKANGGYYKLKLAWASDDITAYIAAANKGIAHTQTPVFCYRQSRYTISSSANRIVKLQAILDEEKWLDNFLLTKPDNEGDMLTYQNLLKLVRRFVQKKKIRTIALGFQHEGFSTFFRYFKVRKRFGLSITELIYSLFEGLKRIKSVKSY